MTNERQSTHEKPSRTYRIAWLPGDGIGVEVLEAARVVLDRIGLAADYIHGETVDFNPVHINTHAGS